MFCVKIHNSSLFVTEDDTIEDVCPDLKVPDNAHVISCPKPTGVATACIRQCASGYNPSGSPIRVCQYNGLWSGHTLRCQPVADVKSLKGKTVAKI